MVKLSLVLLVKRIKSKEISIPRWCGYTRSKSRRFLTKDRRKHITEEYISTTLIYEQVINLSENGQYLLQLPLILTPKYHPSYNLIKKFVFEGNVDRKALREIKKCTR